jgi:DNA repair protein RecN (Recombination protein N)
MLKKLSINNYALIESLEIDFSSGFSVFTGETGSGKTILLGALQLLIGERADFKVLFNKENKCTIEGFFDTSNSLNNLLSSNDLDISDEIIIRREIYPSGKSRAFVNDSPIKLDFLKNLGFQLIDFHGQHHNRLLTQPEYQYSFIDNLGKNNSLLMKFRFAYDLYESKAKKLKVIIENERSINDQRDFLNFQLEELNKYSFENWNENEINEEFEMLSNFESIKHLFDEINSYNSGNDAVLLKVNSLSVLLSNLSKKLPVFKDFESRINSIYLDLNELFIDLGKKQPSEDFDPYKMDELDQKLQLINKLTKKFNTSSLIDLVHKKQELVSKLKSITGISDDKLLLEAEVEESLIKCIVEGEKLYEARKVNTSKIENYLSETLKRLSMPNVEIRIDLNLIKLPHFYGLDQLKIYVSINKGSSFNEISDVASGGEMSRILLAMKSLLNQESSIGTIIFDEIDTGVSGKVAMEVGQLLKELAIKSQVFSITHLPQVASLGEHHFKVEKTENELRAFTSISRLSKESRVLEIASMLGGEKPGKAAIDNASELLN